MGKRRFYKTGFLSPFGTGLPEAQPRGRRPRPATEGQDNASPALGLIAGYTVVAAFLFYQARLAAFWALAQALGWFVGAAA